MYAVENRWPHMDFPLHGVTVLRRDPHRHWHHAPSISRCGAAPAVDPAGEIRAGAARVPVGGGGVGHTAVTGAALRSRWVNPCAPASRSRHERRLADPGVDEEVDVPYAPGRHVDAARLGHCAGRLRGRPDEIAPRTEADAVAPGPIRPGANDGCAAADEEERHVRSRLGARHGFQAHRKRRAALDLPEEAARARARGRAAGERGDGERNTRRSDAHDGRMPPPCRGRRGPREAAP